MAKVLLAALWAANIAAVGGYTVMFAGSSWVAAHPYFTEIFDAAYGILAKLIVLLSCASMLAAVVYYSQGRPRQRDFWRGLAATFVAGLVVLAVELIGTSSGQPFGKFAYTGLLGPKAFGLVPWLVPLSWCAMAVPSYAIASALASNLGAEKKFSAAAVRVGVGTLLLPMRDLTLDPAMSLLTPSWIWEKPEAAQGMPLSNTVGWFATSCFIMLVFEVLRARPSLTQLPLRWSLQFYAANLMLPFGMVLAAQIWGAALLAVAFACLLAALFFLMDTRPAPPQKPESRLPPPVKPCATAP